MSAHRTHRPDGNAEQITLALQGCGFTVSNTGMVGNGFPDLAIGRDGRTWLVEVKIAKGALTEKQINWRARWRGAPPFIVRSLEDVGALAKELP